MINAIPSDLLSVQSPIVEENLAMEPVAINFRPERRYDSVFRKWQGVPSLELSPGGVFWATWYTGGRTEDENNHVVVVCSQDGGGTWSEPVLVIDPPSDVRACDPVLWHDPLGRLWLFWMQTSHCGVTFDGRGGVWAMMTSASDDPGCQWMPARRIANGIMMNKPTVLSTGEWLFPCAVWNHGAPYHHLVEGEHYSNVVVSEDAGETFYLKGSANVSNRGCDEHMFIERGDGSLWMPVRRKDGIGEAVSWDLGVTWSESPHVVIESPSARFHVRRLRSGRLLLINHYQFTGRNNLTASLSEDDGKTWPWHLLLDGRELVTYPDAVQAPDETIHIIYDRDRTGVGEILFQSITEQEILSAGAFGKVGQPPTVVSCIRRKTIGDSLVAFDSTDLLDQLSGVERTKDSSHPEFEYCVAASGEGNFSLDPVLIEGARMTVYALLGQGGTLQVEVEDSMGKPVPGFTRSDCAVAEGSGRWYLASWGAVQGAGAISNRLIRLRFFINNAKVYGFQFLP